MAGALIILLLLQFTRNGKKFSPIYTIYNPYYFHYLHLIIISLLYFSSSQLLTVKISTRITYWFWGFTHSTYIRAPINQFRQSSHGGFYHLCKIYQVFSIHFHYITISCEFISFWLCLQKLENMTVGVKSVRKWNERGKIDWVTERST